MEHYSINAIRASQIGFSNKSYLVFLLYFKLVYDSYSFYDVLRVLKD